MPMYQNSSAASDKLVLGNCKMETSASVAGTYVNVGAGRVSAWNHNVTRYDVQAGNAPTPIEGVADEDITVDFELIEWDSSTYSSLYNGLYSASTSSSVQTIHAGGNTELTARAYKFTNSRLDSSSNTVETILYVYNATIENGIQAAFQDDNASDPIGVMSGTVIGKLDASRTTGQQLFYITRSQNE